ncbi:hypothetical protein M2396_002730 [Pseudomonas sp. BIGb0278]|uniref:hypothetical protein n=1 Tax=Pseudomonas sp. BIGb0278 TaxID=2940607 RepID=UPI0021689D5A|nr:hypothetical protein [Pseudomonas sp. BIGb0278]MCS4284434.1 hypothetical protein [Pseudomonas sp. BIGb0278]
MDTNKMRDISREQFEARFPTPAGIDWNESIGMYEVVDVWKLVSTLQIGERNWRWEGWQASREAVLVELPEGFDLHDWAPERCSVINRREAAEAIEVQGLKVAP